MRVSHLLVLGAASCARPGEPGVGEASRQPDNEARATSTATATCPADLAPSSPSVPSAAAPSADREGIAARYARRRPLAWGQDIEGVLTSVGAARPAVALTFDACGGRGGDGYDARLIAFLRRERVPATLFMTGRWILSHPEQSRSLATDPLFEIENHGTTHRPCSVSGRSAYHVRGTSSVGAVLDEILGTATMIESLTSRAPRFFRPGTAFFDDVCVDVAHDLGELPVGFAVNGDGGAGFKRAEVRAAILSAPNGAIVLMHMNHPRGATADGVMDAVPALRARGVAFVRLEDAPGTSGAR